MKNKKTKQSIPNCTTIQNNQFYGIKWDEPALETLTIVARGLLNLTELFKSQNVKIESLLKVENKKD